LGEHLLCKQGVIGSIPISSTMSPRIRCFLIAIIKVVSIRKQAFGPGFHDLRVSDFSNKVAQLFDNEIDWVIPLEYCLASCEGRLVMLYPKRIQRIQGRATPTTVGSCSN
jgi:hypothetical protein